MSNVITPVLLLVISIGLFFSYIKPAYENLGQFKAQEMEIDRVIIEVGELVGRYDSLLADKLSIPQPNLDDLNKMLPDSLDVVQLILDINAITDLHNLSISSFDVPYVESEAEKTAKNKNITQEKKTPYSSAVLTVEFEGAYANFKKFLFDIEKSMSLVDVVALEVAVQDPLYEDPYKPNKYTIGLQTYWLEKK